MQVYECNKSFYSKLPSMSREELNKSKRAIENFLKQHPSNFYMMLNNESHYYTVYTFKEELAFKKMANKILEIAESLSEGDIRAIENNEDGSALEFWMSYEKEVRVFYLFDYIRGVVEV